MGSKWVDFRSSHSPIRIEINTGAADIVSDWKRLNWDNTFINGTKLTTLMETLGISKEKLNEDNLKFILEDIVLHKVPDAKKDEALGYLMTSFHQGGLLHPVSAAMSHLFKDVNLGPSANADDSIKQVNIVTGENGFSVQEIYTVKKFTLGINASGEQWEKYPEGKISPDSGKEFCIKAQTTLNVSFKMDKPAIDIVNQSISYGNSSIQSLADKRQWYTKVVDYIKNIFKGNSVRDLSSVQDKTSSTTAEKTYDPEKKNSPSP